MAGIFYKLIKKAQQETKRYGFEKIDRERERELVQRLQRDTVSTISAKSGDEFSLPSRNPSRISSAYTCSTCNSECLHRIMCPRYDEGGFDDGLSTIGRSETLSRMSTVKDMNRVVSRLQTPTLSYGMKRRVIYDFEEEPEPKPPPRTLTDKEMRSLGALCRPTYSRRAKQPWSCSYCQEHPQNAYPCDCRCRQKLIDKYGPEGYRNYVRKVVDRVSQPTMLVKLRAEPEEARSKRYRRRHSRSLPLISGLDRSKTVDEVVDRLYSTPCHNAHNDDYCKRTVHAAQNRQRARSASSVSSGPIVLVYKNERGHEIRETIQEEDEDDDFAAAVQDDGDDEQSDSEPHLARTGDQGHRSSFARRFSDDDGQERARRKRNGSLGSSSFDSDRD